MIGNSGIGFGEAVLGGGQKTAVSFGEKRYLAGDNEQASVDR
jgi:hypothetical protein